jgi:hypothetical protein
MGGAAILLQPSLRDLTIFHDVTQGLASWAKFSRPFGTKFVRLIRLDLLQGKPDLKARTARL